jgi:hypothetical protein
MSDTSSPPGRPRPPAAGYGSVQQPSAQQPAPPRVPPTVPSPPPPSGPPPSGGPRPTPLWRTLLYILVPIVGLGLLVAAFVFALSGRSGPVDLRADLAAGTSLSVQVPNAAVSLEPSADDQVHVRMTGSFFGNQPTLSATTTGGVTEVRGGCRPQIFSRCAITVAVQLPRSLPVTVTGQNGRITASALTGRVTLTTTNGAIDTDGTVGRVALQTTNGDIRVSGATSKIVEAGTTNGSVTLEFADAPDSVDASSTNGSVTVRVPVDGVDYLVNARTTNGSVNTDSVPSDSTSRRSITAETTNGAVTVEALD